MNFESLVGRINQVQDVLQAQAAHAINLSLTARNWLVGYHIVEFEQNGEDRAKYGDKLINRLAESINRKGFEPRRLREYRQVYIVYPSLGVEIIKYIQKSQITISPITDNSIWRLSSAKLEEWQTSPDILHNPVTLEFLGLQSQDVFNETKLETAILNHIQMFLLEMGRGFCFEARQKRILVDQDYFKADLIFYHRILKCHVIIDLKIDRFHHEYASQLNFYMNYYKHEVMQADDNPPIGLLLCTDHGKTTVQYATEGLSQNLFVNKYRLQLPSEEEIRQYLLDNISLEEFEKLKEAGQDDGK